MKCPACGSAVMRDDEYTHLGHQEAARCIICGWRKTKTELMAGASTRKAAPAPPPQKAPDVADQVIAMFLEGKPIQAIALQVDREVTAIYSMLSSYRQQGRLQARRSTNGKPISTAAFTKTTPPPTAEAHTDEENELMATTKRGTCPTCKRSDLTLSASGGNCGRCGYRSGKGLDPITGKPMAAPAAPETSAAVPPPAADVPKSAPIASIPVGKQEEPQQDLVPVTFDERDMQLLGSLQEAARYNRRSMSDEILFRLDRSFDE